MKKKTKVEYSELFKFLRNSVEKKYGKKYDISPVLFNNENPTETSFLMINKDEKNDLFVIRLDNKKRE